MFKPTRILFDGQASPTEAERKRGVATKVYLRPESPAGYVRDVNVRLELTIPRGPMQIVGVHGMPQTGSYVAEIREGYGPESSTADCEVDNVNGGGPSRFSISLPKPNQYIGLGKKDARVFAFGTDDGIYLGYLDKPIPGWENFCRIRRTSYADYSLFALRSDFQNALATIGVEYPADQRALAIEVWRQRTSMNSMTFKWTGLKVVADKDELSLAVQMPFTMDVPGVCVYTIPEQKVRIKRRRSRPVNLVYVEAHIATVWDPKKVKGQLMTVEVESPKFPIDNISTIELPMEHEHGQAPEALGLVKPGDIGPIYLKLSYKSVERAHLFDATIPVERGKELLARKAWMDRHPLGRSAPLARPRLSVVPASAKNPADRSLQRSTNLSLASTTK